MAKLKVIELFSGIGAQSKALKNLGIDHQVVATADWDIFANISYAGVHHHEEFIRRMDKWDKEFANESVVERERETERDTVWKKNS